MQRLLASVCSILLLLPSLSPVATPFQQPLRHNAPWAAEAFANRQITAFRDSLTQSAAPKLIRSIKLRSRPKRGQRSASPSSSWIKPLLIGGVLVAGAALVAVGLNRWLIERRIIKSALRDAPEEIHRLPEPVRLFAALYQLNVAPFVDVQGLSDQSGLFVANHAYATALDGAILAVILTLRDGRPPRVVVTGDKRDWRVRLQRWILTHYGFAVIVPPNGNSHADALHGNGVTAAITDLLRQGENVILFPRGQALADWEQQVTGFHTSAIYAARQSGARVNPVGLGGFPLDWTPWDAIRAGYRALKSGKKFPFRFYVRFGAPMTDNGTKTPDDMRDQMQRDVEGLVKSIPGFWPEEHAGPPVHHVVLDNGRFLAYAVHEPPTAVTMNVIYFGGLQESLKSLLPGLQEILDWHGVRWIAFERPGIGTSQRESRRTLESLIADVQKLIERVIPGEPYAFWGNSGGTAYVETAAPVLRPKAVALVAPFRLPSILSTFSHLRWRDRGLIVAARAFPAQTLRILRAQADEMHHDWATYAARTMKLMAPADRTLLSREDVQGLWKANRQRAFLQGARYVVQDLLVMMGELAMNPLAWRDIPVLLVHGEDDRTVPPVVTLFYQHFFPDARVWIVPGAGHYVQLAAFEKILIALKTMHDRALGRPHSPIGLARAS